MTKLRRKLVGTYAPAVVHLLSLTVLSACTTIERQIFSHEHASRSVPLEQVRVLTQNDAVTQCQKLAMLTAKGEQPKEKMLMKLRKAAGKLGANTLLVVEYRRSTIEDVVEGLPEAAAAGALGIDAKPPPAQTMKAVAYHCDQLD